MSIFELNVSSAYGEGVLDVALSQKQTECLRVLGDNIRRLREERALSREAVASGASVDQGVLEAVEEGFSRGVNIEFTSLIRIARLLNVGVESLVGSTV